MKLFTVHRHHLSLCSVIGAAIFGWLPFGRIFHTTQFQYTPHIQRVKCNTVADEEYQLFRLLSVFSFHVIAGILTSRNFKRKNEHIFNAYSVIMCTGLCMHFGYCRFLFELKM